MALKPAQLIVDPATQAACTSELARLEADWLRDGYQPTRKVWPPGQTAVDLYRYINSTNCVAAMPFGDVPIPRAGPVNPDGHTPLGRMIPTDVVLCGDGYSISSDGQFIAAVPLNFLRRVMRVTYEGLSVKDKMAEYRAYLDRNHASRTGQFSYERRVYVVDHDAWKFAIGGQALAQLRALYGDAVSFGLPDHQWDQGGDGQEYYKELEGHTWLGLFDFGGGYPTGIYYSGDSGAMEEIPDGHVPVVPYLPVVAVKGFFASDIPDWDGVDAYLKAAMRSGLFAFSMTDSAVLALPDFSLIETLGVPEMLSRYEHGSLAYGAFGDPTQDRVPTSPASAAFTIGGDRLSQADIDAINKATDLKLQAMHDALQADYTAKISAAVALFQTSQGQTGAPTGTVPATGNSGAPPTGTGAVPALVINCGAADSLSAKSGFVWLNLPEASVAIDLTSVAVPLPIGVYHSGRGGPRAEWAFPGYPAGALAVRLDFNEPHWVQPGNRLQDVIINGVKVLSGFDIVSVSGALNKAVSKSFTAQIGSDGVLSIVLTATPGSPDTNTYLCAIGIG